MTRLAQSGDMDRDPASPPIPRKLDPYKRVIDAWLEAYPKLSSVRLLEEIRAAARFHRPDSNKSFEEWGEIFSDDVLVARSSAATGSEDHEAQRRSTSGCRCREWDLTEARRPSRRSVHSTSPQPQPTEAIVSRTTTQGQKRLHPLLGRLTPSADFEIRLFTGTVRDLLGLKASTGPSDPSLIRSPSASATVPLTRTSLTKVPLLDPRSRTAHPDADGTRRACRLDTTPSSNGSIRMPAFFERPTRTGSPSRVKMLPACAPETTCTGTVKFAPLYVPLRDL